MLPDNTVRALISDGEGGLWIGTDEGNLAHYKEDGTWEVFNKDNSGLLHNDIMSLLSDGEGGLWIGTWLGGLTHMTFSAKERLARKITDESQKEELLHGKRAAIIVQPRGSKSERKQLTIEKMTSYAYKTLLARGYDNSEIYFLSYKPDIDINGDDIVDMNVVDGPVKLSEMRNGKDPRDITVKDIKKAFSWAKEQGSLDLPLLFIFVAHGGEDGILLSPLDNTTDANTINARTLKRFFDDYQSATGNTIIAMFEASYSGSFVDDLAGKDRIIITSAGKDTTANYADFGYQSFTKFFFDNLRKGLDFHKAFTMAKETLSTLGYPFTKQTPLFNYDGDGEPNTLKDGLSASEYCLNGCFGSLANEVVIEPVSGLASIQEITQGEEMELRVRVSATEGNIRKVKAVIRTPESYYFIDEFGTSAIPSTVINLTRGDDGIWSGSFKGFEADNEEYYITFTAEDQNGFVSQSKSVITLVPRAKKELDAGQMEGSEDASEDSGNGSEVGRKGTAESEPEEAVSEVTAEMDIETAYPILTADEYHYGDTLAVMVLDAPQGIDQYVAIGLPDGSIYLFTYKNIAAPFASGGQLPMWHGGYIVLDIPLGSVLGPPLPAGRYTVYLIRIQAGLDPLINYDALRFWVREFNIVE